MAATTGVKTAASSARATPRARLVARLDDWLNPIVVKELRQAVRAKYVLALFLLFLICELAAMGVYVMGFGGEVPLEAGRTIFWILYGMATSACVFLVPIYCGARLSIERGGKGELMFATALPARSIVWGKLLSGLVLIVIIYSACAPFMAFTYLLRGIDLPTIFVSLAGGVFASASLILFALFIASMPISGRLKVLLVVLMFMFGPFTLSIAASVVIALALFGPGFMGGGGPSWAAYVFPILLGVVSMGCLFVWTVALLSPLSANRALPMRAFMTGAWLVTGAVAVAGGSTAVTVWSASSASLFCLMYLVAICERERIGPRVARAIPQRRWLQPFAFLLYSGAAGGVAWSSVMLLLTLGVAVAGTFHSYEIMTTTARAIGGMALSTFAASVAAVLIHSATAITHKSRYTWASAIGIHIGASALLGLIAYNSEVASILLSAIWAVVMGVIAMPWFLRQVRAFRPYSPEMAAALAGRVPVPRATIPVAPRAIDAAYASSLRLPPVQTWTAPPTQASSGTTDQQQTPPPVRHEE